MGRSPCCEKDWLNKGVWTQEEDQKLISYIEQHGIGSWPSLPAKAGLQRSGKSCRLRWTNYLRPDIKRGKFSQQEEETIIRLHALLGSRWSVIATHLPNRSDNEIKNYWNTHLKKRLANMGVDPATHKPCSDALGAGGAGPSGCATGAHISHTVQWQSARLEAEVRQARPHALVSARSPQMLPGPAVAHQLASPTPSTLSFSGSSTAQASVLEALRADPATTRAAAMPQPMQARPLQMMPGPAAVHRLESPTSSPTLSFPGSAAAQAPVLEALRADAAAAHAAYAHIYTPQAAQARRDPPQQQRWGDHVVDAADADITAAAFAGMLLDESLVEQATENEKSYWVGIMNLVNSSSPALSSAMPAPEAYSWAASSSASVADDPPCPRPRLS